jgi:hypothetical protein
MIMRKLFTLAVALVFLTSCEHSVMGPLPNSAYKGADHGYVVLSIEVVKPFAYGMNWAYRLDIRKRDGSYRTNAGYARGVMFGHPFNMDGPDKDKYGAVAVRALSPGEYEIYNYGVSWTDFADHWFNPKSDFSIPFTVKTGETTYIGNFGAIGLMGRSVIGADVPAGILFVIRDEAARDIAVAKGKVSDLGPVKSEIADPKALNIPEFIPPPPGANLPVANTPSLSSR